jgi:hypothetical protein
MRRSLTNQDMRLHASREVGANDPKSKASSEPKLITKSDNSLVKFVVFLSILVAVVCTLDYHNDWSLPTIENLCFKTCDTQAKDALIAELIHQRGEMIKRQDMLKRESQTIMAGIDKLVKTKQVDKATLEAVASKKYTEQVIVVMRTTLKLAEKYGLTRDEAIIRMVEHMKDSDLPIYSGVSEGDLRDPELWNNLSKSM